MPKRTPSHNRRVIERCERPRLLVKPEGFGRPAGAHHAFERDPRARRAIEAGEHHTHSAATELTKDFVPTPEYGSDGFLGRGGGFPFGHARVLL